MASPMFETYTRTFARFSLLSLIEDESRLHATQSSVAFRNTSVSKRFTTTDFGTSHSETRANPTSPPPSNSLGIALAHHRLKYAARA